MRHLVTALAAVALLALAGCGADDEKDVKDAVASMAVAFEAKDGNAACQRMSRRSRELMDRVFTMGYGTARRCADMLFRGEEGDPGASLNEFAASAENLDVVVDGDRAVAREKGSPPVPMLEAGGEWTVDLYAMPNVAYAPRASAACGESRRAELREPLPAPTRAALARATRRQAASVEDFRRRVARLEPPPSRASAHRALLRELSEQVRIMRSIASRTAGVADVAATFNRAARRIAASDRRLSAAQERLRIVCLGPQAARNARGFLGEAQAICTSVGKRMGRLQEPRGPQQAIAYVRRLEAAGRSAMRRLARLDAPRPLAARHRESIAAYRDTIGVLAAERRAISAGRDPAPIVERLERASVRSSMGFRQLALPACAAL